jgi:hypothetical protein
VESISEYPAWSIYRRSWAWCLSLRSASRSWQPLGVNRTYQDITALYGTTIMPARPRGDSYRAAMDFGAAAQPALLLARRAERVIRILVDELNVRLMRKLGASRREPFDTIDERAFHVSIGRTSCLQRSEIAFEGLWF